MKFEQVPVLETMIEFYAKPKSLDKFQEYLKILQGDTKGAISPPIGGFNPMAKGHLYEKLIELKELNAENIIYDVIDKVNLFAPYLIANF